MSDNNETPFVRGFDRREETNITLENDGVLISQLDTTGSIGDQLVSIPTDSIPQVIKWLQEAHEELTK